MVKCILITGGRLGGCASTALDASVPRGFAMGGLLVLPWESGLGEAFVFRKVVFGKARGPCAQKS